MHNSTDISELHALLALRFTPHLGPLRIQSLLKHFGSAGAVLSAKMMQLRDIEGLDSTSVGHIGTQSTLERATLELERCAKARVQLLGLGLPNYPLALRALPDPPTLLWLKGDLPELAVVPKAIGIVGSRNASAFGVHFAHKLAKELAEAGVVVVSGLARGIDTAAHKGCLEGGSPSIAVMGSSVDIVYPSENKDLSYQLALLSEQPIGTAPAPYNFPGRNRIIAALSAGSVMIEGHAKSGALITTNAALECGRSVFAVPGRPLDPLSGGAHRLLREGAVLLESAQDIFEELNWKAQPSTPMPELPPEQMAVWKALEGQPLLDDLSARSGLAPAEAQVALMMLTLQGLAIELPGGRYSRA